MNQHNWISIPSAHGSDIAYDWCTKCGTLRLELIGEIDPYEFFIVGRTDYKKIHGSSFGLPTDSGCISEEENNEHKN